MTTQKTPAALSVTTPGDRELRMVRAVMAAPALVYRCYTEPALVRRWLLGPPGWTMPVCVVDLRVGGRYRYVWQHADGRTIGMGGTYLQLEAPHRIVHTELFDDDWTGGETTSTITLQADGAQTIITTSVIYASAAARDGAMQTGMLSGMEDGYRRLDEVAGALAT